MKPHWDIFCKVVDNFGDIGVCWRLARQLTLEHGLQVRLLVDDLQVSSKIIPTINFNKSFQIIDNIEIINFNYEVKPAEVVIEAFACGLPEKYQSLMAPSTIWVNLEYLSAENWVADFHGRHSKVGQLTRHFYFPGFTDNTGGLIREKRAFEVNLSQQNISEPSSHALNISLFCYPNAPIADLLTALQSNNHAALLHVPATSILPQIAQFFAKDSLEIGETVSHDNLSVNVLPFLSQDEYDQLLRDCDINFVRGEDSWVRAIWAGKPFIWQPYVQTENTHMTKLKAFLNLFYTENESACKAHIYWSSGQFSTEIWQHYLNDLPAIQAAAQAKSMQLTAQTDLATKLVEFVGTRNFV